MRQEEHILSYNQGDEKWREYGQSTYLVAGLLRHGVRLAVVLVEAREHRLHQVGADGSLYYMENSTMGAR
jgi:hypothetical protein